MIICKTYAELKNALENKNYAFVPTMGNLHAGHISLIETAKKYSPNIVFSIFINPKQFAPHEDFASYPRTLENDIKLLQGRGVQILYTPRIEDIYPQNSNVVLDIPHLTQCLCGKSRPHFFNGVMNVLLQFYLQIMPKYMVLGEKDYQQFLVVREMAKSLNLGTEVVSSPIVRDSEGLAMSSRNGYLSSNDLIRARQINKILTQSIKFTDNNQILEFCTHELSKIVDKIDYIEIRNNDSLELHTSDIKPNNHRIFFAGFIGKTRLIDNMRF
jgi:pantoate--beta-alanine ligase